MWRRRGPTTELTSYELSSVLTFLAALYNEDQELPDLLSSVSPWVDGFAIVDDGSTDKTPQLLERICEDERELPEKYRHFKYKRIKHTGLPETAKNEALSLVPDGSWVLMLDADERIDHMTMSAISQWIEEESDGTDYVYLRQFEEIDGVIVREFQKCKLFRKESVRFPLNNIHADDQFVGNGTYHPNWIVSHRKSSTKQIVRETEYLATYKRLLDEGKIDSGRYSWLVGLHHYVKPHG